jgi:hypothetical protein
MTPLAEHSGINDEKRFSSFINSRTRGTAVDECIGLFSSFEIRPAFNDFPGGW